MNIMDPDQDLKKRIMFRVRVIFFLRKLSSPLAIEGILFVVLGSVVTFSVSIPHVIANMSQLSYITDEFRYLCGATMHTRHITQAIMAASMILLALITRDIYKNMRTARVERVRGDAQIA